MTKTLVDRLEELEFKTISLIATNAGEPIYNKLGFIKEYEYHFFSKDQAQLIEVDRGRLRTGGRPFLKQIMELDKQLFGENRWPVLREHLESAMVFVENEMLKNIRPAFRL